jgi:hypothetical protein
MGLQHPLDPVELGAKVVGRTLRDLKCSNEPVAFRTNGSKLSIPTFQDALEIVRVAFGREAHSERRLVRREPVRYSVGVDFDGVLLHPAPFRSPELIEGVPVHGALGWLEQMTQRFDVFVHSTRAESIGGKEAIERWLVAQGPFGAVKASAVKAPALLYVDDRGWRFTGHNFPSPDDVHRARPWWKERE